MRAAPRVATRIASHTASHTASLTGSHTLTLALTLASALAFACATPTPARADTPNTPTQSPAPARSDETYEKLATFAKVLQVIQNQYVEDVPSRRLIYAAIKGMLSSLDPHSAFFTPEECQGFRQGVEGEFGGVGIVVDADGGIIRVTELLPDAPAARAGVQPGDVLTHIDNSPVAGLRFDDVVAKLRGAVGSNVTLTFERTRAPKPVIVTLVREQLRPESVISRLLSPGYGYIRVTAFQERTAARTEQALADLAKQSSGKLRGLVLDLRGNPGGLLEQSIELADLFLSRGVIVSTRGRDEGPARMAHEAGTQPIYPMVVLVDGGTASASEIVAGALQDYRRALLVGTPTFGKGSVQTVIELADGACVKVTVARYYTPSGRSIQELGIVPDVLTPAAGDDSVGEMIVRERDLDRHLAHESDKATSDGLSDEDAADPQLRTAWRLLLNWDVFRAPAVVLDDAPPAEKSK